MAADTEPRDDADHVTTSRRGLLARGGAAAAMATVAAVSLADRAQAGSGNGTTFNIGAANDATATTQLTGSTLRVDDGATSGGIGGPTSVIGATTLTDGVGVLGQNEGANGTGVFGFNIADDAIAAVHGITVGGNSVGVYGWDFTSGNPGVGVYGESKEGVGVLAEGGDEDLRAGGSGRVRMAVAGVTEPPSTASVVGTIARDAAGNLWYCAASGTPGTWRKLAGTTAAGAYHAIEPTRVYDSRRAATPGSGLYDANSSKTVSVKDGRDLATGAVTDADIVPAGATAITFNVTVAATTAGSFLAVAPGDAPTYKASTLNWAGAGAVVANASTVKLDASRQVKVFAGPAGTFHAIIDVTGYYL